MVHDVLPTLRTTSSLLSLLLAGFLFSSCGNDAFPKPGVDIDMTTTPMACSLSCSALKDCRLECETDTACIAECEALASPEATASFAQAKACLDQHGCTDQACVAKYCAAPVAACLPPGEVEVPKVCAPTCNLVLACVIGCHDDPVCRQTCIDTAAPIAKKNYNAALTCVQARGCADLSSNNCDATPCRVQLDRCQLSRP